MKINTRELELTIARSGMTIREIQKKGHLSALTLARARHDPEYHPNLFTLGKLARALSVDVEALIEGVTHEQKLAP